MEVFISLGIIRKKRMSSLETLYERKEIIQDVIDRLLVSPDYKHQLIEFNKKHPLNIQIKRGLRTVQH